MSKRKRPPAISLTEAAYERILQIMKNADKDVIGIRIGLKNKGCAGMSYIIDAITEADNGDEVIDFLDFKIVIETKSLLFLLGMQMDFKKEKMRSGFVFNNPNQTDACGCGESVKLVEANPEKLK